MRIADGTAGRFLRLAAFLAPCFWGCSSGDAPSPEAVSLEGDWKTSCLDTSLLGMTGGGSFSSALTVGADDRFTEIRNFFSGADCSAPTHRETLAGSVLLGAELTNGTPPLRAVNWTYTSLQTKPVGEGGAEALSSSAHCGFEDWTAAGTKDVAGRTCAGVVYPEVSKVVYDVVEIAGDTMAFGRLGGDRDGSSESRRPQSVRDVIFSLD